MIGGLLAAWLGAAAAAPAVGGPEDEAALAQVAVWIDLDELGRADALTRRALRSRGDDPRWIRARLDTLAAAGMDGWIHRELERPGRGAEARAALLAWRFERGDVEAPPTGSLGAEATVRRALAEGRVDDAAAALAGVSDAERPRLTLAVAAARGEAGPVLDAAGAWDVEVDPLGIAPLWQLEASKEVERARKAVLARLDAWSAAAAPGDLVRLSRLYLAIGDRPRLEALGASVPPVDLQGLMDALAGDAATFDAWQLPPRPRWAEPMLKATAEALSRQDAPSLPWLRPSERDVVVELLSESLARRGRAELAAQVAAIPLGACGSREAERLIAAEDEAGGRARMKEDLLRCVGGLDLVPMRDPAGLDLLGTAHAWAAGWQAYGDAAQALGRYDESRVAWSVALWLEPTEERLGLVIDAAGGEVPAAAEVAASLEAATWLRPSAALDGDRARRAVWRTITLLRPDAESLAAQATPMGGCVPTLRSRCMVEAAAAALAAQQAGGAGPTDDLDPGAVRQAELWLASVQQRLFTAQAEVQREQRRLAELGGGGGVSAHFVVGGVVPPAPATFPTLGRSLPWQFGPKGGADYRDTGLVVTVWASWCAPCRKELAWLDDALPRWREGGAKIEVLAVGVDTEADVHAREAARLRLEHLLVVHDPSAVARYHVDTLPFIVLIDRDGVVRETHIGWSRSTERWLDGVAERWAAEDASRGGGG